MTIHVTHTGQDDYRMPAYLWGQQSAHALRTLGQQREAGDMIAQGAAIWGGRKVLDAAAEGRNLSVVSQATDRITRNIRFLEGFLPAAATEQADELQKRWQRISAAKAISVSEAFGLTNADIDDALKRNNNNRWAALKEIYDPARMKRHLQGTLGEGTVAKNFGSKVMRNNELRFVLEPFKNGNWVSGTAYTGALGLAVYNVGSKTHDAFAISRENGDDVATATALAAGTFGIEGAKTAALWKFGELVFNTVKPLARVAFKGSVQGRVLEGCIGVTSALVGVVASCGASKQLDKIAPVLVTAKAREAQELEGPPVIAA